MPSTHLSSALRLTDVASYPQTRVALLNGEYFAVNSSRLANCGPIISYGDDGISEQYWTLW
jgi:hypothetical protein